MSPSFTLLTHQCLHCSDKAEWEGQWDIELVALHINTLYYSTHYCVRGTVNNVLCSKSLYIFDTVSTADNIHCTWPKSVDIDSIGEQVIKPRLFTNQQLVNNSLLLVCLILLPLNSLSTSLSVRSQKDFSLKVRVSILHTVDRGHLAPSLEKQTGVATGSNAMYVMLWTKLVDRWVCLCYCVYLVSPN